MIEYALMAISVSAKVLFKSLGNFSSKHFLTTSGDVQRCNLIETAICFILFTAIAITDGISLYSVCLGILFGCATLLNNTYYLKALSEGPMNITDLIVTSSMLIPAMSGVFLFNETLSIIRLISTCCLIFFIYLTLKPDKRGEKANKRWLLYCFIAFITQGGVGVMQKIHQHSVYKDELSGFLAVAFFTSFIFALFAVRNKETSGKLTKNQFLLITIQGVCMFLMHFLNLKLSGIFPSQFFFPVSAGSGIILVLLISTVVFKEKLTKKQLIGLIGGFASILCIGSFQ